MGRTKRITRSILAGALVVPLVLGVLVTVSSAAPSKQDVENARAKLAELNLQMEAVVERYNTAREQLDVVQERLDAARATRDRAQATADAADQRLEERAAEAFMASGSEVTALLDASDLGQFSDRLEFMGAVAETDADIATDAATAQQHASWAAQRYDEVVTEREQQAEAMLSQLDEVKDLLDQQQALYERLDTEYQQALARQRAAAAAAEQAVNAGSTPTDTTDGSSGGDTGGGGYVPPGNGSAAAIAIDAARSVIGAQYVFGTAGPDTFDCSGLTLWAYAKAGISLPHSSQMQYDMFPKVSRDQLQPGDLIFFFSPIHHVAIYLGGNSMLDTVHPGADGAVAIRGVWWDLYVGATRPY